MTRVHPPSDTRGIRRIALDANQIREDFGFRRNPSRLLLREARHARIGLLIPEVALDEAVNLYRELVRDHGRAASAARDQLVELDALDESDWSIAISADDAAAAYRANLESLLAGVGAEILPYPTVSHEQVVRRALARAQPFDGRGRKGYRDVLLWETLVAAAADTSPITLVSRDAGAFGPDRKADGLAPELVQEVEALGFAATAIDRITEVKTFTDVLPSVDELVVEAEHLIASNATIRSMVEEGMIEEATDYDELGTSIIGLELIPDYWYIAEVHEVSWIRVVSARELDDRFVALDLKTEMKASLNAMASVGKWRDVPHKYAITQMDDDLIVSVNRVVDAGFEGVYDRLDNWITPGHAYSFIPIGDY